MMKLRFQFFLVFLSAVLLLSLTGCNSDRKRLENFVTLLDKPARRTKPIAADLAGFEVPDEFVVGYGLDYAQKYRNMPYIGVLKPEVYAN